MLWIETEINLRSTYKYNFHKKTSRGREKYDNKSEQKTFFLPADV